MAERINRQRMTQTGFIRFGNGLNRKAFIKAARDEGKYVRVRKGYAEIYSPKRG